MRDHTRWRREGFQFDSCWGRYDLTNSYTWPSEVDPTIMAVPVSTILRSVPSDEDGVDGTSLGRDPSSPFHQELCHEDIKRKLLLLSPSVIGDVMRPKVEVVCSGWMLFTIWGSEAWGLLLIPIRRGTPRSLCKRGLSRWSRGFEKPTLPPCSWRHFLPAEIINFTAVKRSHKCHWITA